MNIHFTVPSLVKLPGVTRQCGAIGLSVSITVPSSRPATLYGKVGACRRIKELITRVCCTMDVHRIIPLRDPKGWVVTLSLGQGHAINNRRTLLERALWWTT